MILGLRLAACMALMAVAGCTSFGSRAGSGDRASMTCAELNREMAEAAVSLSGLSSRMAQSQRQPLSGWIVGGEQVQSVLNDRRAAEIDRLRAAERGIEQARRDRGC